MVGPLPRVVVTHWVHPEVTAYLQEFSAPVVPPEDLAYGLPRRSPSWRATRKG